MANSLISINPVQPIAFPNAQMQVFQPKERNYSLLAQSMQMNEQREQTAAQQKNLVDQTLAEFENKLSKDSETRAWWAKKKNDIIEQIQGAIDVGDYATAIKTAQVQAGKITNDSERINRTRTYEEYTKYIDEVKSNQNLDELTKQRLIEKNQYYYSDDDPNWKPQIQYVKDLPIIGLQEKAAAFLTERKKSNKNTTGRTRVVNNGTSYIATYKKNPDGSSRIVYKDKDGNIVENASEFEGEKFIELHYSNSNLSAEEWKNLEDIEDAFQHLINDDPEVLSSVSQKYENYIWAYDKYMKQAKDLNLSEQERQSALMKANSFKKNITDHTGKIITDQDLWIRQQLFPQLQNKAYRNTVKDNSSIIQVDNDAFKTGSGIQLTPMPEGDYPSTDGPLVETEEEVEIHENNPTGSSLKRLFN